ncbi:hypothetical protein BST61_g2845 [Cercospora zeina]
MFEGFQNLQIAQRMHAVQALHVPRKVTSPNSSRKQKAATTGSNCGVLVVQTVYCPNNHTGIGMRPHDKVYRNQAEGSEKSFDS